MFRPAPANISGAIATGGSNSGYGRLHEKAIDGTLNYIGGGDRIYLNYRFAQPTRTSRQHIARWDPEFQFPFADVAFKDPVTHPANP